MTPVTKQTFKEALQFVRVDGRVRVRYTSNLTAFCRKAGAPFDEVWSRAQIRNVSAGGICLRLRRHFEPNAAITIEPPQTKHGLDRLLEARVVYANEDDGYWIIGCEFSRLLNPDEVQHLL